MTQIMSKLAQFKILKGIKAARFPSFLQFFLSVFSLFIQSYSPLSILVSKLVSNILAFPVNLLSSYSNHNYKYHNIKLNLYHPFTLSPSSHYFTLPFTFTFNLSSPVLIGCPY